MAETGKSVITSSGRRAALLAGATLVILLLVMPIRLPSGSEVVGNTEGGAQRLSDAATDDELHTENRSLPVDGQALGAPAGPMLMPLYVSPQPDHGSHIASYEARRDEGWATGLYTYWSGDIEWNSEWQRFVDSNPEGVPVLGSPKGVNPANVHGFLESLPQNWREQWIMAYYQEPEDNFTTPEERKVFRERVSDMADMVRPYGVKNAVHLQEWTIHPSNNKPWGGEENLAPFITAEDLDYISWSLYPGEGQSMRPGIDRIKAFSEKYAPGVPWGVTAAGSPVKPSEPSGSPARVHRAEIVEDAAQYTADVGGESFGWFDWDEYLPGQDNLVSKDPVLQDAMHEATEILLPRP